MPPRRAAILIDASVAGAATRSDKPQTAMSRAFLENVYSICHSLARTGASWEEWKRHETGFTRTWLTYMFGSRKVGNLLLPAHDDGLRERILRAARSDGERRHMADDYHLVAAAMQYHLAVASLDDRARNFFSQASRTVEPLRGVIWVNPGAKAERPLQWLAEGAPDEKTRRLGFDIV